MTHMKYQGGATLLVAMMILLMMTLFAVTSINLSSVNLKIVGNLQAQKILDARAQDAIEQILSDQVFFNSPASTNFTYAEGTVAIDTPVCVDTLVAEGYSAVITDIIPQDNSWEITATITDSVTNAQTTLHQGVEMRMLAGNCP
jgi:Tfp pilus assembly protein PilX